MRDAPRDYRARATRGVAFAGLTLMLPFSLYALFNGLYVFAAGATFINACLIINTWLVARGRDHEPATLFCLVPVGTVFMGLSFAFDGSVASAWCFPSVLACYCMLDGRRARISNIIILCVALPMAWRIFDTVDAVPFVASLLAVSLFAGILVREIDAQQRRLQCQLLHDPLTGLLNRVSLATRLDEAIASFKTTGPVEASMPGPVPVSLLAIDLDHFKRINDRFGHEAGDRVLCKVARLLESQAGDGGAAFRIGGEEFLVLLPEHDETRASRRAESIRAAVAGSEILADHPVTTSIGVATLQGSEERQGWVRRADEQLYRAKRDGRDRVMTSLPAAPAVPALRAGACRSVPSQPLPVND